MTIKQLLEREAERLSDTEIARLSKNFMRLYGELLLDATGLNKIEGITNGEMVKALMDKNVTEPATGIYMFEVDPFSDPIALKCRKAAAV